MWYMIPGFNGYEINENKIVRSMKMFNADPGHLLKLRKDGTYELSDNHCKRVRRTPDKLWELVLKQMNEDPIRLRVREENDIQVSSRNKFKSFYPEDIKEDERSPGAKEGHNGRYYMDFSWFQNNDSVT